MSYKRQLSDDTTSASVNCVGWLKDHFLGDSEIELNCKKGLATILLLEKWHEWENVIFWFPRSFDNCYFPCTSTTSKECQKWIHKNLAKAKTMRNWKSKITSWRCHASACILCNFGNLNQNFMLEVFYISCVNLIRVHHKGSVRYSNFDPSTSI